MSHLIRKCFYARVCLTPSKTLFWQMTFATRSLYMTNGAVSFHCIYKRLPCSTFPLLKWNNLHEVHIRSYAKGKSKLKGDKKQKHAHMTEDELSEIIDVEKYKTNLQSLLEELKNDFLTKLSLRTSLGSLESLPVELEGKKYTLAELAQVIRKTPSLIIINATAFPQATTSIKKTLMESGMNLNPQQDGVTFYITIPKVTKEHRLKFAQNAKVFCDQTKDGMKDVQNKYLKMLKPKEGKISEDSIFNAQIKIREIAQNYITEAETLMKKKQNELTTEK